MGLKISSLPVNSLPYSGSEKLPLVQSGVTKAGTLSSFVNYLSGALPSGGSNVSSLTGNWQSTYTTFSSNSANYAVKNADNNFNTNQTFTDDITIGTGTYLKEIPAPSTIDAYSLILGYNAGANDGSSTTYDDNVFIGYQSGNDSGSIFGATSKNIGIGYGSLDSAGSGTYGSASNNIALGESSGINIGSNNVSTPNTTNNIISIGSNAGSNIGSGNDSSNGNAVNVIAIGNTAGTGVGSATSYSGDAVDVIAIGSEAGIDAGSGGVDNSGNINYSVFLGVQAGHSVGKGDILAGNASDIIAIGRQSGYESNIGATTSDNIYIGRESGYRNGYSTNSQNNIFIGLSSGYNKQGSRNTFIGDLTNTTPTDSVNLSGCIAIGYGAQPTARNTIALGSASTPLSVVPGASTYQQLSGLKVMINGTYYTIPLFS
jgi:hypothetical protein